MDDKTRQAIKDMRFDLAKLELRLYQTPENARISFPDGTVRHCREIIEDQILEVRSRLKVMLDIEKFYEEKEQEQ